MTEQMLLVACLFGCATLGCGGASPPISPNVTGSGVSKSETRSVRDFAMVELYGVAMVTAVPGMELAVTVEADDNMVQYAKTNVEADTLRVGVGPGTYVWKTGYPRFRVPSSRVHTYSMEGQTWLDLKDVDQLGLRIKTNGQCFITLTGFVGQLNLDLAGQTSLDASNATLESIQGKVDGKSTVKYRGEVDVKATTNSGSKIERVEPSEPATALPQ